MSKFLILIVVSSFYNFYCAGEWAGDGSYLSDVPSCMPEIRSDSTKNGTFYYPKPSYPQSIHCRYDFIGNLKERVRIEFTEFNLYPPDEDSIDDCAGGDVISSFVHNHGKLERVEDFCGVNKTSSLMSNSNKLTLELYAPYSTRLNRSFTAFYSFVTDYGIETGRQDIAENDQYPNPCTFLFNSTDDTRNGNFTSPNYPGLYPRDTMCDYLFYGKKNERIDVSFNVFHIDGIQPCDGHTYSDYVEFSNYINVDRKFMRQCGTLPEYKISSDNNFFRITFKSNDRYDATGFLATYQFSVKSQTFSPKNYVASSGSVSMIRTVQTQPLHSYKFGTLIGIVVSVVVSQIFSTSVNSF